MPRNPYPLSTAGAGSRRDNPPPRSSGDPSPTWNSSCRASGIARSNRAGGTQCESVIKSVHRMTYKDVNAILDGDKGLINEYSDIYEMLKQMLELSKILRAKKFTMDMQKVV